MKRWAEAALCTANGPQCEGDQQKGLNVKVMVAIVGAGVCMRVCAGECS